MHILDRIESVRQKLLYHLGLTERIGQSQYVGQFKSGIDEFEHILHMEGFSRNPLAWLKLHEENGTSKGSWARRQSIFTTYQLHVTVYEVGVFTSIYAHYEYNFLRHPLKHLYKKELDYDKGVEKARHLFEKYDEFQPPEEVHTSTASTER